MCLFKRKVLSRYPFNTGIEVKRFMSIYISSTMKFLCWKRIFKERQRYKRASTFRSKAVWNCRKPNKTFSIALRYISYISCHYLICCKKYKEINNLCYLKRDFLSCCYYFCLYFLQQHKSVAMLDIGSFNNASFDLIFGFFRIQLLLVCLYV